MWGWSISRITAFQLLDTFYSQGGRYIDTASNYPINGICEDYSLALNFIEEWSKLNGIFDLKVIYKVGSTVNINTTEINLSGENIRRESEIARSKLDSNLYSMMIHWDNRTNYDEVFITLDELSKQCKILNCRVGISGIKDVLLYKKIFDSMLLSCLDIEVKSNFLVRGESHYSGFKSDGTKIWAYGISGSGLKLNENEYRKDSYVNLTRSKSFHDDSLNHELKCTLQSIISKHPQINNLYQLSMVLSELNYNLYGYLVSPSNVSQLTDILNFKQKILDTNLISEVKCDVSSKLLSHG